MAGRRGNTKNKVNTEHYRPPGPGELGTAAQAQDQVQRALLLDVVVGQRAAVLELLARKDEALLVRRNIYSMS